MKKIVAVLVAGLVSASSAVANSNSTQATTPNTPAAPTAPSSAANAKTVEKTIADSSSNSYRAVKDELEKFYAEKKKLADTYKQKKEALKAELAKNIKEMEDKLTAEAKNEINERKDRYKKSISSDAGSQDTSKTPVSDTNK